MAITFNSQRAFHWFSRPVKEYCTRFSKAISGITGKLEEDRRYSGYIEFHTTRYPAICRSKWS
jgi:hypothetical protein